MSSKSKATTANKKSKQIEDSQSDEQQEFVSQDDFDQMKVKLAKIEATLVEHESALNSLNGVANADKGGKKVAKKAGAKGGADPSANWVDAVKAALISGDQDAYAGWRSVKGWAAAVKGVKVIAGVKPDDLEKLTAAEAKSVTAALVKAASDNEDLSNALVAHLTKTLGLDDEESGKGKSGKTAGKQGASKKKAAQADESDADDGSASESDDKPKGKGGKKTTPAKKAGANKKKPAEESDDDADDGSASESDDKPKGKGGKAAPKKSGSTPKKTSANKKKAAEESDDGSGSDDDSESASESDAKPKGKGGKAAPAKNGKGKGSK